MNTITVVRWFVQISRAFSLAVAGNGLATLAINYHTHAPVSVVGLGLTVVLPAAGTVPATILLHRTEHAAASPGPRLRHTLTELGRRRAVRVTYWATGLVFLCWTLGGLVTLYHADQYAQRGQQWHTVALAGVAATALGLYGTGLIKQPNIARLAGGWDLPVALIWRGYLWAIGRITHAEVMPRWVERRYRDADTWPKLADLIAQWCLGELPAQPAYCGPCDLDSRDDLANLSEVLAAANRAGFITHGSQAGDAGPGADGQSWWRQHAAVHGFARPVELDWLIPMVNDTPGLRLVICGSAAPFDPPIAPVTFCGQEPALDFGTRIPDHILRDDWTGFGVCHPDVLDALCRATQIVIYDTQADRNDRLWPALLAAARSHQLMEA